MPDWPLKKWRNASLVDMLVAHIASICDQSRSRNGLSLTPEREITISDKYPRFLPPVPAWKQTWGGPSGPHCSPVVLLVMRPTPTTDQHQQYLRQGRLHCAVEWSAVTESQLSILYHFLENDLSIALLFIIIVVIITATWILLCQSAVLMIYFHQIRFCLQL